MTAPALATRWSAEEAIWAQAPLDLQPLAAGALTKRARDLHPGLTEFRHWWIPLDEPLLFEHSGELPSGRALHTLMRGDGRLYLRLSGQDLNIHAEDAEHLGDAIDDMVDIPHKDRDDLTLFTTTGDLELGPRPEGGLLLRRISSDLTWTLTDDDATTLSDLLHHVSTLDKPEMRSLRRVNKHLAFTLLTDGRVAPILGASVNPEPNGLTPHEAFVLADVLDKLRGQKIKPTTGRGAKGLTAILSGRKKAEHSEVSTANFDRIRVGWWSDGLVSVDIGDSAELQLAGKDVAAAVAALRELAGRAANKAHRVALTKGWRKKKPPTPRMWSDHDPDWYTHGWVLTPAGIAAQLGIIHHDFSPKEQAAARAALDRHEETVGKLTRFQLMRILDDPKIQFPGRMGAMREMDARGMKVPRSLEARKALPGVTRTKEPKKVVGARRTRVSGARRGAWRATGDTPDPVIRQRLVKAKTTADISRSASAEARRITGRDIEFDLGELDPALSREGSEALLRGLERYPEVNLTRVATWNRDDGTFATNLDLNHGEAQQMRFNIDMHRYGVDAFRQDLRDKRTFHDMTVNTPMGVAFHEFGHAAANHYGLNDIAIEIAQQQARDAGVELYSLITGYLGRYGNTNERELSAEVFADFMLRGKHASPLTLAVMAEWDRRVREWRREHKR